MVRRVHKWTPEERETIRLQYDGTREVAERLALQVGVSYYAVRGQARQMGLAKHHERSLWTEDEENLLEDLIGKFAPTTIAKRMKRSPASVVSKAKRMGLMRQFRDGWYTKSEAGEILGLNHLRLQRYIDSGVIKASSHYGSRPTAGGTTAWHIRREDLRDFIRSHAEELTGRNVDLFEIVEILVGVKTK